MKNKDLVFYAVSTAAIGLFMLIPFASGFSISTDFPGMAFCMEWIQAGENFVVSGN